MDFILGCNYWASNAGADMWRKFDLETVKKDLNLLSEHGINCLRVFPNWRDFQPVMPVYGGKMTFVRYLLENDVEPQNPYFLDEIMMDRFSLFLDECEKRNIKLIVGLITGFMSGRIFIPSVLYGKNLITDSTAIYFEKLFIKGFVSRFKDRTIIYGWDLGNECNVMSPVENRIQAVNWISSIANAIRAEDSSRPIVSGMHGLSVEGNWRIDDNAMFTDMLTTHPYPFWCEYTKIDKMMSYRTTLHPTAQTKYYSEIGKKPCLAEELGTMGPSICEEISAADFLRINTLSLFSNSATGVMWWCAFDQNNLRNYPYAIEMVERELGMASANHEPKPVLLEMKKLSNVLNKIKLPQANVDAVCLLSKEQRQWGVGYMTYALMKKVGLNCSFDFVENEIPNVPVYMLPSMSGAHVLEKEKLEQILANILDGATLYMSTDNAVLSGFEKLTGLRIKDSFEYQTENIVVVDNKELKMKRTRSLDLAPISANVLLRDIDGNPLLTVNSYGKGKIYYLNFSLENYLVDAHNVFDKDYEEIYKIIFSEQISRSIIDINNKNIVYTTHNVDDGQVIVILNHSAENQEFNLRLKDGYCLEECIYGEYNVIKAWDGLILKIKKQ